MNTLKRTTLALVALAFLAQVASADCCCPSCGEKVCRIEAKTETVTKKCYQVECKEICIPKIKFCWPWQRGAKSGCGDADCTDADCTDGNCSSCSETARCGKVKTVKVLKKVDYECKKCGYDWKIYDVGCTSRDGCTVPASGPVKIEVGDRTNNNPRTVSFSR
jgi:hypothetical protein